MHKGGGFHRRVAITGVAEPERCNRDHARGCAVNAGNKQNKYLSVPHHEYMVGAFSPIYMSRKRKCGEHSYTIQAGGRNAPLNEDPLYSGTGTSLTGTRS